MNRTRLALFAAAIVFADIALAASAPTTQGWDQFRDAPAWQDDLVVRRPVDLLADEQWRKAPIVIPPSDLRAVGKIRLDHVPPPPPGFVPVPSRQFDIFDVVHAEAMALKWQRAFWVLVAVAAISIVGLLVSRRRLRTCPRCHSGRVKTFCAVCGGATSKGAQLEREKNAIATKLANVMS